MRPRYEYWTDQPRDRPTARTHLNMKTRTLIDRLVQRVTIRTQKSHYELVHQHFQKRIGNLEVISIYGQKMQFSISVHLFQAE